MSSLVVHVHYGRHFALVANNVWTIVNGKYYKSWLASYKDQWVGISLNDETNMSYETDIASPCAWS